MPWDDAASGPRGAWTNAWPAWPLYGLENDLLPPAEACLARAEPFALATLVRVEGSSPRAVGAEMLISASGRVHGYVSGGCVEAAVAQEALACLQDGRPRLLSYGQGSPFVDIQLTCGGQIQVFVRRIEEPAWWVSRLREVHQGRRPLDLLSDLRTGAMCAVGSRSVVHGFVKRYEPGTRLLLVGSDPVTLAAAMLGRAMGMEVVLWRPGGPAAPPPGIDLDRYLSHAAPEGLRHLELDRYSALYCLTHDLDLEAEILRAALATDAFCVGALGSRLKRTSRLQRLSEAGASEGQIARLRTPAGLQLGAVEPQGIALSILAEVVALRAAVSGGHPQAQAPASATAAIA